MRLALRAQPPAPVDGSVLTADVSARDVLRCGRDTLLPEGVGSVFEIVIDGVSEEAVREAMRRGLHAAAAAGAAQLSAANFGGGLGPFHFPLSELQDPP